MQSSFGNSAKSLQQQYRATLLLRGGLLLAALFAYAWISVGNQRDALHASVKAQGEQLKLSLDDTIDVVRAHAFTMRRSVEHIADNGAAHPAVPSRLPRAFPAWQ